MHTATLSSGERNSESRVWYCCETLELVVELAEVCPAFLRPRVAQCVAGMVQVCVSVWLLAPWWDERERETRTDTRIERCLCTYFSIMQMRGRACCLWCCTRLEALVSRHRGPAICFRMTPPPPPPPPPSKQHYDDMTRWLPTALWRHLCGTWLWSS